MTRKRSTGAASRGPRHTPAPPRWRRPSPLHRLLTVIAAAAAAGMMVALSTQYARTYTLARQASRLEQHRHELVAQNEALREEIQQLETDDRYIERIARQQLGLVRPGEIEFLIVPGGGAPPGGPDGPAAGPADVPGAAAPGTATTSPRRDTGVAPPRATSWRERLDVIMKHLFGWLDR